MIAKTEAAILAGGCFWGMQELLRRIPTVVSTRVGYTGGDLACPTYEDHGTHAEAIEIVFDPELLSYKQILEFFFRIHDPTSLNRQGANIGTRYRSAIFYLTAVQRRIAEAAVSELDSSGLLTGRVVTTVEPAGPFWEAEPEHQAYFERHPEQRACNHIRPSTMSACDRLASSAHGASDF
ncbi:peptide-methionine (S)-S-oxide reductase MsrA [Lysobacter soli]|uniref:peptide-methionine (S)-S-oxide reductase MsrA n=1 Tax=Lysobacter soli TaxID=453783 RepID=UPI0012EDC39D|nr:peptide-methionine (S)-S-oxide reductase MsrA [Lysobacter soli]QGW65091.1 peptide-methionine (S)-S-oxide reductase MsrA [Lysobacter soli]